MNIWKFIFETESSGDIGQLTLYSTNENYFLGHDQIEVPNINLLEKTRGVAVFPELQQDTDLSNWTPLYEASITDPSLFEELGDVITHLHTAVPGRYYTPQELKEQIQFSSKLKSGKIAPQEIEKKYEISPAYLWKPLN